MKKILLLMTGGTIGSSVSNHVMDVHSANSEKLLDMYKHTYNDKTDFEVMQPMNLLSENLLTGDWLTLYNCIRSIDCTQYAGIIITHGSDTLAYTSSIMGYLCAHIQLPVILTASNYPLGEPESNGLENFRSAVVLIQNKIANGVYTVYQNNRKENIVYLATRITSADYYTDQFRAFADVHYASVQEDALVLNPSPLNPAQKDIRANSTPDFGALQFCNEVVMLHAYPGLNYDNIRISPNTKAVVQILYHASTACTCGNENSVLHFIERCKRQNVDFYASALKKDSNHMYTTTKAVINAGAKPLYNISPESAYTKLCLAYNQNVMPVSEVIKRNLFFEVIE